MEKERFCSCRFSRSEFEPIRLIVTNLEFMQKVGAFFEMSCYHAKFTLLCFSNNKMSLHSPEARKVQLLLPSLALLVGKCALKCVVLKLPLSDVTKGTHT